jgi:metallo-beta-lactamase class B
MRPDIVRLRAMIRKLLVLLVLAAPLVLAQESEGFRKWNQPVTPFRIAGNLYYVGANELTSYLIATPKGHIVLDGGLKETAPQILANIRALGFKPEDVKILLNSHAHTDHAGGLAELKRVTGAMFYASRADIPQLARGGTDDPQFGERFPFPGVVADRIVEDGMHITLGGTTMVAHLTPGHTPGCTTWTTRVRENGEGLDVVFVGSPTVPSEYRLIDNPRYPNAIADYRKQFATLKTLGCDIFLASHGNFFGLDEMIAKKKRFAGCDAYRALIADWERRFEARAAGNGPS